MHPVRGVDWRPILPDRLAPPWALVAALLFMGCLAAPGARAQTPPGERPVFEVASIKRHTDAGNFRMPTFSKDRFTFAGPVVMLIATAYGLPFNPSRRLSGGPDWIRGREGLYDIEAKGSIPDGLSTTPARNGKG